ELVSVARGRLDAGAGGDAAHHDLRHALRLQHRLQVRAGERAPALLGHDVVLRLAVELKQEVRKVGGNRAEAARLLGTTRRRPRDVGQYDRQAVAAERGG